jgi:fumarylacetoacetate (FAA) hydrolase
VRSLYNAGSLIQSDNSAMKLATYQDGSRDGQLVVVSRDLGQAHYASHIANRMQQVLDDWNYLAPQLQDVYDALNAGRARHAFAFNPAQCLAPLPRAYQWADAAAYPGPGPSSQSSQPSQLAPADAQAQTEAQAQAEVQVQTMRQHSGDSLLGAHAPMVCANADDGIDFEAGIAVITGDVPMGSTAERALDGIRLVVLANTLCLRSHNVGAVATAFSPVAITPDELGEAWSQGRVSLPLQCTWNGRKVGLCDAGTDMALHFGQLIAQQCQTRAVHAGTIVGAGPVRNRGVQAQGRIDWPKGYSSIADKRAMETLQDGQPTTAFMQMGDTLHIELKARDGQCLMGAIAQEVQEVQQPMKPQQSRK